MTRLLGGEFQKTKHLCTYMVRGYYLFSKNIRGPSGLNILPSAPLWTEGVIWWFSLHPKKGPVRHTPKIHYKKELASASGFGRAWVGKIIPRERNVVIKVSLCVVYKKSIIVIYNTKSPSMRNFIKIRPVLFEPIRYKHTYKSFLL